MFNPSLSENKRYFILYLIKFLISFCILYFGTKAIIGLSVPGGYYSPFVQHYLNYISLLRASLLHGSKLLIALFGYGSYLKNSFTISLNGGVGVILVYSCLGYGIMSFWIAFIFANAGNFKKKIVWILAGLLIFWLLNIVRISLLLIALNKHWYLPKGLDHHSVFNVLTYVCIFVGIYFYDRSFIKSRGVEHEG